MNGGAAASWLASSSPDRAVRVRVLSRDNVLYSWGRHFNPTVPLRTQVYELGTRNLMLGVTLQRLPSHLEGSQLRPDGPLRLYANFSIYKLWMFRYLNGFCIGNWIVHCRFQHIVVNDVQSLSSERVTA